MKFLSNEEIETLKNQHREERDCFIRDRIKAVLLYDKGWSMKEIADVLMVSIQTVSNHIADYKKLDKLKPERGGSEEKLSKEQSEHLETHLQENIYLRVKDIQLYIMNVMGVKYTVSGLNNWLRKHGFRYKKPEVVPGKANKQEQEQWINNYEKLRENLSPNETIGFMDGVHPTHNVQPAYGWIKKGVRKKIKANTGRQRINLSGFIDITSHTILMEESQALNADSTIKFFKKIEKTYSNKDKIHIFCDNARYYRNKLVTKHLKTSKIELHFLPIYSPNLNPIERLWKFMKEKVTYNRYYEYFCDFKSAVMEFFSELSKNSKLKHKLKHRVRDNFKPIEAT